MTTQQLHQRIGRIWLDARTRPETARTARNWLALLHKCSMKSGDTETAQKAQKTYNDLL